MTVRNEQMSAISVNVKSNSSTLCITKSRYNYFNTKAPVINHLVIYEIVFSVMKNDTLLET